MRRCSRLVAGLAMVLLLVSGTPVLAGASRSVALTASGGSLAILAVAGTRPARPTHFRMVVSTSPVTCPASFKALGPVCVKVFFSWLEASGSASFRIYHGFTGEGPDQLCADQLKHATFLIGASAGGRHRTWYRETDLTGGGTECYWIEAVNAAGHSQLVALTGQAGPQTVVVTMADRGATIQLVVGQQLLVELSSGYDWSVTVSRPQVLAPSPGGTLPAGAQALYIGATAGTAVLQAAGDPTCRKLTPPCGAPSILFSVTIVVR
jgi:hypothetical protein